MKLSLQNSDEIPSLIGFKGVRDGRGTDIGYKLDTIAKKLMTKDDTKAFMGDFLAYLCAGKHLILIYTTLLIINTLAMQKHLYTSH